MQAKSVNDKKILILSVFVVASCGLAYELIAGALSSYLLGDSVLQFSTIIGCYCLRWAWARTFPNMCATRMCCRALSISNWPWAWSAACRRPCCS
jgi:hypothetical protein